MVEITVLFASFNGEYVLPRTLEGYVAQSSVPFSWKLVIVDNASTDGTAGILEQFASRLPLQRLHEAQPGKNRALNRGLVESTGEAVIISDDDSIPAPTFLTEWRAAISRHLEYDLFGGAVEPQFEVSPPLWMARSRPQFGPLFGERDLPDGPIDPTDIFGPNMAVRRRVFQSGLSFDETIGPNALDPNYPMGSETEFVRRAARQGHKAWFAAAPKVEHIVRPSQLTPEFWKRRAYRHGRGVAQQQWETGLLSRNHPKIWSRRLIREARFQLKELLQGLGIASPWPLHRFNAMWEYHWTRGFHDEYRRRATAD